MKYIHTRTGAIIDSSSTISGGCWIPYDERTKKIIAPAKNNENGDIDQENIQTEDTITKAEIMQELDALGIEYNKKAKKEDLYKLMTGA